MDFGIIVPQGWRMDLVDFADPSDAYEAMSRVAQQAEELEFSSVWLYDHFHTVPAPRKKSRLKAGSARLRSHVIHSVYV